MSHATAPVIAGLAVGIAFVIAFSMFVPQRLPLSIQTPEEKVWQQISAGASCRDADCAIEIIKGCIVPNRIAILYESPFFWIIDVKAPENEYEVCRIDILDSNIGNMQNELQDFILHECPVHEDIASSLEHAATLDEMVVKIIASERCGVIVP